MITVMSFDEILTKLCDDFDELISPKRIARSNTNIIYLIFKAVAKGCELVNNICVTLDRKFDPERCTNEDLISVAHIVGTERRRGTASGLHIFVTNTNLQAVTLRAGVYVYALDDEVAFEFEVISDTVLEPSERKGYIAMSRSIGRFPVTEQTSITITSEQTIPDGLNFSNSNNNSLLGNEEESILAFRKRILGDYTRQESMHELEEALRNLPYIFDCKVAYNNTSSPVSVGSYTLPPMTCAIFYSGEAKREIAQIVASYIVCPTLSAPSGVTLRYESSVFVNGYHNVNIIPFEKLQFTLDVAYRVDDEYTNVEVVLQELNTLLMDNFASEKRRDIIKEEDIYEVIASSNKLTGLTVLSVNLRVGGVLTDYIEVTQAQIAELTHINFGEA